MPRRILAPVSAHKRTLNSLPPLTVHNLFCHDPFWEKGKGGERKKRERENITLLIEATTFATQPIYNTGRAAHALR